MGGTKIVTVLPKIGYLSPGKENRRRYRSMVNGKTKWVHRLICEAFNGPCPTDKHECMHLDENGLNNRPENLAWGTASENQRAPKVTALRKSRIGLNSNRAKLSDEQVREIRRLATILPVKEVAKMFGITGAYVRQIRSRYPKARAYV